MRGSLYWHIDAVLGALSQTWQDGVGVGEGPKLPLIGDVKLESVMNFEGCGPHCRA